MAIGDGTDATAGGMAVVLGSVLANTIDTELTKTRDYIANGPVFWKPGITCSIAKGGTGANTAAGARTALGIIAANIPTATGTVQADLTFLGARIDNIQASNVPSAGGSNVQADLTFLGARIDNIHATNVPSAGGSNVQADLTFLGDRIDGTVSKSGDTMSGHLYLPASSPATASWTAAFINGDGRVSRGASSIRFKDLLDDPDVSMLGNVFPRLREFTMKDGDGKAHLGHIAEELAADEATERFVVYETEQAEDGTWQVWRDADGNPVPLSIDFISLLLTQTAVLHAELEQLRARVDELEGTR